MSRIFLSHSSVDEVEAVALRQWLADNGWDDVFLDIDPERGLAAGDRWQDALRRAADRCEAVVFVVSPAWAKSKWCLAEFLLAKNLNKLIFGVVVKEVPLGELPTEMTSEWQLCSLVGPGATETIRFVHHEQRVEIGLLAEGLGRLRSGLQAAGLSADYFPWPPKGDESRSPYRGLEPLGTQDAAVFFGRDAEILQGLDRLRGMRGAGDEGLFVILGASGSGKSSFLRAGLLPRLARDDRHFVALSSVRPERRPLSGDRGLATALARAMAAMKLPPANPGDVLAALKDAPERFAALLRAIQTAAQARLLTTPEDAVPPTIVLPVDQAEELFGADATDEARTFLNLIGSVLREAIDPGQTERRVPLIVVFTIRSDRYEPLQTAPELAGLKTVVFDGLRPMPAAQFKEIITGPARRAAARGRTVEFKPDLVGQLLADCGQGADTLPLLSLTLARLFTQYGADGDLRLNEYLQMGGMADIIHSEAESVIAGDPERRRLQLDSLHAAFIPWLATINPDNDQPVRRIARLADLPQDSVALVQALIDRRLLLSDARDGEVVIEVAHESLLRQWTTLADWLRMEREDLKDADRLEQAATAWTKSGRKADWLIEGERLAAAQALAAKPAYSRRLAPIAGFLLASQQREAERRAEEARARLAELDAAREKQAAAESLAAEQQRATLRAEADAARLRTRGRQLVGLLATAGAVAVIAAWFAVQANRQSTLAERQFTQATALRLNSEAQAMLSGARGGGSVVGLLTLLAAHRLAPHIEIEGSMLAAVLSLQHVEKIFASGGRTLAFTPDGARIVAIDEKGRLRLWDAASGQPIGEPLQGHEGFGTKIAFSPDGQRMIAASDRTPRIWNAKTGKPISGPMEGHEGAVTKLAFTPDGTRVITSSMDRTLRIWDGISGQPLGEPLRGHTNSVLGFAVSPVGTHIASFGADSTLRLWEVRTGQPIGAPMWHDPVGQVVFSPDGRRIASSSYDVRLWDAESHAPIGKPMEANPKVSMSSIAFSGDGTRIVATDLNNVVRSWGVDTQQPVGEPTRAYDKRLERFGFTPAPDRQSPLRDVAFSPDDTRMISAEDDRTLRLGNDRTLRLRNVNNALPVVVVEQNEMGIRVFVAFSPDGSHFVTGTNSSALRLWDAANLQPIGARMAHAGSAVLTVAYSPDGRRFVSGGYDATLQQWDVTSGKPVGAPMRGHTKPVNSAAFSPDGTRIASASDDGTLRLWDATSGEPVGVPMTGHESGVESVAFSPDGRRIVSGGIDRTLRVWDAANGQEIGNPITGHTLPVTSVVFSRDGTQIVSGSDDATVRVWDAADGRQIGAPMTGHRGSVLSVALSADGTRIVSGGNDQALRLWDMALLRPVGGPITGHNGLVATVAFSPDGTRIISSSDDLTVRLWPAPKVWPDILCAKLTRNLSHLEWRALISPDISYRIQCDGLPIPLDEPATDHK